MSNFSAIQVLLQWDDDADDGVRFVLDQHALRKLNFYRASSLKQQSEGRHVSSLGHIILISSQQVFAYSLMMREEAGNTNLINLWFDLNGARTHDLPHSNMLTITPLMWFPLI